MAEPAAIPGATKAVAARLQRLGIHKQSDLPLHLPLRFEDETRITAIADAPPGVVVQCAVTAAGAEVVFRPRRQLLCRVSDDSGVMLLRFLNFYPSQQRMLQAGARLLVFGEVRDGHNGPEMIHPRCRPQRDEEALPQSLTPVYPVVAGLPQATIRRLITRALEEADLDETLPEEICKSLQLHDFADSVRSLHAPPPGLDMEALEQWRQPYWRRIAFDELLAQQLSLRQAWSARRAVAAPPLNGGDELQAALLQHLPFRLTAAQQRVSAEIAADLKQTHPMQRLLQGDVGSGKTIIAALAMLRAVASGHQAALMAPTEILAEQHHAKLNAWLTPLGLECAWLGGGAMTKQRRQTLAKIAAGDTPLVVGTHALIEEQVAFARLGLAVVDEQHRFGVRQRLALKQKKHAIAAPVGVHQLAMSATPIPRSLAMSYYADLDVSVIDEMPPGRQPVLTKLISAGRRPEIIARVRQLCSEGRQAYWVCPLIEESETLQLQTAVDTRDLLAGELPELRIGLVHGRLKADEKAQVMNDFLANNIQLLVATTVIEVGVDAPNASLMVIEHAERFGLAQLHQLRGRVGRGAAESACILLYDHPLSQNARQRLKIIYENNDGFAIAREDLRLRGPGEFIGARQSGLPLLRFADLEDEGIVNAARAVAERMLEQWPQHARRHLERWLGERAELLKA